MHRISLKLRRHNVAENREKEETLKDYPIKINCNIKNTDAEKMGNFMMSMFGP